MEVVDLTQEVRFDPARPTTKVLVDTEKVRVVLFCLEAGQVVPAHGADAEVVFYTVEGTGVATVGDEEVPLRSGVVVRCPPNVQHGLQGGDALVVMAAIAPRPW